MAAARSNLRCSVAFCGQLLTTKSSLRRHMQTVHGNERSYICAECDMAFKTHARVSEHQKVVHSQKKYACVCGYQASRPQELRRHQAMKFIRCQTPLRIETSMDSIPTDSHSERVFTDAQNNRVSGLVWSPAHLSDPFRQSTDGTNISFPAWPIDPLSDMLFSIDIPIIPTVYRQMMRTIASYLTLCASHGPPSIQQRVEASQPAIWIKLIQRVMSVGRCAPAIYMLLCITAFMRSFYGGKYFSEVISRHSQSRSDIFPVLLAQFTFGRSQSRDREAPKLYEDVVLMAPESHWVQSEPLQSWLHCLEEHHRDRQSYESISRQITLLRGEPWDRRASALCRITEQFAITCWQLATSRVESSLVVDPTTRTRLRYTLFRHWEFLYFFGRPQPLCKFNLCRFIHRSAGGQRWLRYIRPRLNQLQRDTLERELVSTTYERIAKLEEILTHRVQ